MFGRAGKATALDNVWRQRDALFGAYQAAADKLSRVEWSLDQPAQVNRSDWTKRRQVMTQPGPSLWSCTAEFVARIGELDMVNSFRLGACEGPAGRGDAVSGDERRGAVRPHAGAARRAPERRSA